MNVQYMSPTDVIATRLQGRSPPPQAASGEQNNAFVLHMDVRMGRSAGMRASRLVASEGRDRESDPSRPTMQARRCAVSDCTHGRLRFIGSLARYARMYFAALLIACAPATSALAFTFQDVVSRAQQLVASPYRAPPEVPSLVRQIGYDQHRGIRYRLEHNLWRDVDSGFEVSPVMPGNVYKHAVPLNEVDGATVRPVPFRKEHFSFDDAELARELPDDLGYAGFELSYPMHHPGVAETFFVFAGASYFRGIGKAGQFGLSIRGAAIDTGLTSGEEFPDFVEFWLVKPAASATELTVYALLNSRRLTGAYEFVIAPGEPTRVAVRSALFTRERIEVLGIAPLTSMYFYGENSPRPLGAWRPEIHDSDGLAIANLDGDRLWHPLLNPSLITIKSFPGRDVRSFGLLQRDTQFASYEDPGTNYHRRPSATVELGAGLRAGRIVLVQLPTSNEFLDNIVAFWSPMQPVRAGARLDLQYQLNLGDPSIAEAPLARVVQTFVGRDVNAVSSAPDRNRFIVDFAGRDSTSSFLVLS